MGFPEPLRPSAAEPPASTVPPGIPCWVRLGCLLAWLGVCLCFLLLQKDAALHSYFCPLRGGCETVLGSQYATLDGVPLPWLGVGFYGILLGLWLAVSAIALPRWRLRLLDGLLWLVLAGFTFSLGLMYLQFAVLHAFCPLCTTSALTVGCLVAVTLQARRALAETPAGASPGGAVTLALFAAFPLLILAPGTRVPPAEPSSRLWAIDLSTAHRTGPADAPVQLVVFSDFQCAFCRQLAPVLQQVRAEFPRDVSVVFRHFPLAIHPRALAAAVAAECAGEQGKFWEYHDRLFAEGGNLDDAQLLTLAAALGLDQARFQVCLASERPRQVVAAQLRDAGQLGLPGTPMVFLNGRRIEGPLTHENLTKQIQAALPSPPHPTPPAK